VKLAAYFRSVAQRAEEYFGPDGCDHVGDTLREPYVRAIAGLFGRCREKSEMKVAPWTHRLSSPDRKKTRV